MPYGMYNINMNMPTVLKLLLACLICIGVVLAVVYAGKWLW